MDKSDFLKELSRMTKEQINNIIKSNGKEPKLINPIEFIDKNTNDPYNVHLEDTKI